MIVCVGVVGMKESEDEITHTPILGDGWGTEVLRVERFCSCRIESAVPLSITQVRIKDVDRFVEGGVIQLRIGQDFFLNVTSVV